MKNLIWLTTLFVLSLILIVPGVFAFALDIIPDGDQPGYNSNMRIAIYGARNITQKFTSRQPNLAAVGTSIRNPNLKNKKEVFFRLYDESNSLLRTSILNGQNLEDGNFVKFLFEPIADSIGKTYMFTIDSTTAGPEETIEVFYIEDKTENIIEFTYDEKTHNGGMPLVTFHKPKSKLDVVKSVYMNLLSRLLFKGL